MKKFLSLLISLVIFSLTLSGCDVSNKNPVTLNMWHNYGGDMQQAMDILIDEFNGTVGKDKGIIINVTAISSSSELNENLDMIANGDPGAPEMPDIFTGYPKVAMQFAEKDMLADFADYFNENELSEYVAPFVEEGRLSDGGIYVFPIAKSTEVLYLNKTLFDDFASKTDAKIEDLATFEGIARLSEIYYEWSGGKQFFATDSWFNLAEVGMAQLGKSIFDNEALSLDDESFDYIMNVLYPPAVNGGIIVYDGYSSDLSKTGDIVCSIGSSAGILFYGDTITLPDGSVKEVTYDILPYPIFQNGDKKALQRGGGLMVAKTNKTKEAAACEFIKWLTASDQNMKFIGETGYLPVTVEAFENALGEHIENLDDVRIRKMLTSVTSMYGEYTFFTAPNYSNFDNDSESLEALLIKLLTDEREKFVNGEETSFEATLSELKKGR